MQQFLICFCCLFLFSGIYFCSQAKKRDIDAKVEAFRRLQPVWLRFTALHTTEVPAARAAAAEAESRVNAAEENLRVVRVAEGQRALQVRVSVGLGIRVFGLGLM